MVQFIQDFFLSPFLILIILLAVFFVLSWWALKRRKEYLGYGLGWLVGVFSMVVYGALVGDPQPTAQDVELAGVTLNLFQVILPSFIGIAFGAGAMALVNQTHDRGVQQSIVVAILTAIAILVLFLMVVSSAYPVSQRMIGLFALAFSIGAVTMMVVFRQGSNRQPDSSLGDNQPDRLDAQSAIPTIPGNDPPRSGSRSRERFDRRR